MRFVIAFLISIIATVFGTVERRTGADAPNAKATLLEPREWVGLVNVVQVSLSPESFFAALNGTCATFDKLTSTLDPSADLCAKRVVKSRNYTRSYATFDEGARQETSKVTSKVHPVPPRRPMEGIPFALDRVLMTLNNETLFPEHVCRNPFQLPLDAGANGSPACLQWHQVASAITFEGSFRWDGWVSSDGKYVVIAFRATQPVQNWLTNLNAFPVSCEVVTGYPCGNGHMGFLSAYSALKSTVREFAKKWGKDRILLVTGHSLAGAMSSIATMDLAGQAPVWKLLYLASFASPVIGNRDMLAAYDNLQSMGRISRESKRYVAFTPDGNPDIVVGMSEFYWDNPLLGFTFVPGMSQEVAIIATSEQLSKPDIDIMEIHGEYVPIMWENYFPPTSTWEVTCKSKQGAEFCAAYNPPCLTGETCSNLARGGFVCVASPPASTLASITTIQTVPTRKPQNLGDTCCPRCSYKDSCCCPPDVTKTVLKTVERAKGTLTVTRNAKNQRDIARDVAGQHLCPTCKARTGSGKVCCNPVATRKVTKTVTKFAKVVKTVTV
jgi:hypothetical protein